MEQQPLDIHVDRAGRAVQFGTSAGFESTRLELPIPGLAASLDGLRIVHLSDLHGRPRWDTAYDRLIEEVNAAAADLILFTGDFVENKRDAGPALPVVRRLFSGLTSRLGTFAILGNHDGDLVGAKMADFPATLVDHRRVLLQSSDAELELIGLPGVLRDDLDMAWVKTIPEKKPGALRIVLCHFPDLLPRVRALKPDLYLTGHTHGGQVALPGGMPILRHDRLPRRLCTGIHRAYDTILLCNRGFGFSSVLPLRVFCPAQIVQILIRRN